MFYGLYQAGGDAALIWTKTLLGLGAIAFVWATARLNGAGWLPTVLVLAISMPVFGYGMMPRAQVFTYFLFAAWLYLLERQRRGTSPWELLALPITMLAWANLHGGFLAGLGLLALYALGSVADGKRFAILVLAGVASALVTLVNPYGFDYWKYLLRAVTMARPGVNEWSMPPLTIEYAQFWLLAAASLVGIVVGLREKWLAWPCALALGVTLALSLRSARHMPLLAICACSFLPGLLPTPRKSVERTEGRAWFELAAAAALVAVIGLQVYGLFVLDGPFRFDYTERSATIDNAVSFPVAAIEFAQRSGVRGNLAVPFNWGEFAIWNLWPDCRVSMDGRYETAYPDETVRLVEQFFAGAPAGEPLLNQHRTDHVLAPADSPVNELMRQRTGWRLVHADGWAKLWSRTDGGAKPHL